MCCIKEGIRTFPRRFFSRLYWQTYSNSIQREHGDWPLHLVRMRWQWSQARLTRRLTGAELLRSSFGMSAVAGSMVAIVVCRKKRNRCQCRLTRGVSTSKSGRKRSDNGKIWGRSCVTWGAYVGPRSVSAKQFRPGGILVAESHDLNLLCVHASSRSEITSSVISEDAIVNSTTHGCMERLQDWLADLGGHLRSAPGFRRRHLNVLLSTGHSQRLRLNSLDQQGFRIKTHTPPHCQARERPFLRGTEVRLGARQHPSRHYRLATLSSTLCPCRQSRSLRALEIPSGALRTNKGVKSILCACYSYI
jgi:hypothetical protein